MSRTIRTRSSWVKENKHVHIECEVNRMATWHYQWYAEPMPVDLQIKEIKSAERDWWRSTKDVQPKYSCKKGLKNHSKKYRRINQKEQLHKIIKVSDLTEHEFDNSFDFVVKGFGWFYD